MPEQMGWPSIPTYTLLAVVVMHFQIEKCLSTTLLVKSEKEYIISTSVM